MAGSSKPVKGGGAKVVKCKAAGCAFQALNADELEEHFKMCHVVRCRVCNKVFQGDRPMRTLENHIERVHGDAWLYCVICGWRDKHPCNFKRHHEKAHSWADIPKKPSRTEPDPLVDGWYCSECGFPVGVKGGLKAHLVKSKRCDGAIAVTYRPPTPIAPRGTKRVAQTPTDYKIPLKVNKPDVNPKKKNTPSSTITSGAFDRESQAVSLPSIEHSYSQTLPVSQQVTVVAPGQGPQATVVTPDQGLLSALQSFLVSYSASIQNSAASQLPHVASGLVSSTNVGSAVSNVAAPCTSNEVKAGSVISHQVSNDPPAKASSNVGDTTLEVDSDDDDDDDDDFKSLSKEKEGSSHIYSSGDEDQVEDTSRTKKHGVLKTGMELSLTPVEKDPVLKKYVKTSTPVKADEEQMEIILDASDDDEKFVKPCPKSVKKKRAQKKVSRAVVEGNISAVRQSVSRMSMVLKGVQKELSIVRRMSQRALLNSNNAINQSLQRQNLARSIRQLRNEVRSRGSVVPDSDSSASSTPVGYFFADGQRYLPMNESFNVQSNPFAFLRGKLLICLLRQCVFIPILVFRQPGCCSES